MKKNLFKILILSSILTTLGFIMDGDPKEPSMLMRFVEFFAMIGTIFLLFSLVYFITTFTYRKIVSWKVFWNLIMSVSLFEKNKKLQFVIFYDKKIMLNGH